MDAAIPADAQNAPTGIWKSRTEREIPTAPTPIIVVVNERKNNGDSNSVAKPSTESDQAQLAESAHELFPTSFSPNRAQILAYGEVPGTADDIEVAVVDGDGQTTPLLQTVFSERNADLSPNGRWVAYESNESGQEEIYVRPYPEIDSGRWQVSTGGGTQPLWARSGGELFYRNGAALMAVPIEANPNFSAGTPEVLFEGSSFVGLGGRTYDVSRDDERFILIKEDSGDTSAARQLIVVQNWFEELRQRVPVP